MVLACGGWHSVLERPPVGVQLRLWVELLSGGEVEIHGVFLDSGEWDLSLGWRLNVLRIKYWQAVEGPPVQEPGKVYLPEVKAVLREPRAFSEMVLCCEGGGFTLTAEELRRGGEWVAALWLWTGYESERVPAPDAEVPDTVLGRFKLLRAVYHRWRFDLETRLTWVYHQLAHQELRDVHLEPDMQFFIENEKLVIRFGDDRLQALAGRVKERIRLEYLREKGEWIERWGSEELRVLQALGRATEARYAKERAALEYPGFILSPPIPLPPPAQEVPLPFVVKFGYLVRLHGFQWYDHGSFLMLAKINFLGKYYIYRSFSDGHFDPERPGEAVSANHRRGGLSEAGGVQGNI